MSMHRAECPLALLGLRGPDEWPLECTCDDPDADEEDPEVIAALERKYDGWTPWEEVTWD